MMVVIAVIGILSGIGLVALQSQRARGRNLQRTADVAEIQAAMEKYYTDHGHYPYPDNCNSLNGQSVNHGWNGLASFLSPSSGKKYIAALPNDPLVTQPNHEQYAWRVIVSGPSDKSQHYIIEAPLESIGATQILSTKQSLVGTVYQQLAVQTTSTPTSDAFIFISDVPDLNENATSIWYCNDYDYKPYAYGYINCGTWKTYAVTHYSNLRGASEATLAGTYNTFCLGNIYKTPTRAMYTKIPATDLSWYTNTACGGLGGLDYEPGGDPAGWEGSGCLSRIPTCNPAVSNCGSNQNCEKAVNDPIPMKTSPSGQTNCWGN